ncbi:hypothetical protein [Natranaeroarchaeum aerophilus]|uniref:DUF2975 domain-containing protein n=1 Tax=Natranaeroarchaeum aerophilus TaxID=2917711 RepID=A0AAE3K6P3_9EURY|nr:hypothetical protein [Natranaeroarchaeum aerophilus]MCL9815141.1 hypothetical protein [Natranaeroarchaeum aerophilus]
MRTSTEQYSIATAVWIGSLILVGIPVFLLLSYVFEPLPDRLGIASYPIASLVVVVVIPAAVAVEVATAIAAVRLAESRPFARFGTVQRLSLICALGAACVLGLAVIAWIFHRIFYSGLLDGMPGQTAVGVVLAGAFLVFVVLAVHGFVAGYQSTDA